ncbi:MAG: Grx4 family monothiol glutaredoxin [Myxococcota bacterium]
MSIPLGTKDRIQYIVDYNPIVLFMKGSRSKPQCGFSATVVAILDLFLQQYAYINVLQDEELRRGIKAYSDWPTVPQLYVKGQFVGGCDIVKQLYVQGELFELLGVDKPTNCKPNVVVTQPAQEALANILQDAPSGEYVRLQVDARGLPSLKLEQQYPHDLQLQQDGITFVFDPLSASRAQGLRVDYVQEANQSRFAIRYV